MDTTTAVIIGSAISFIVGIFLGAFNQCRIDNKELERFLFKARKQGFEEGYDRGLGKKDHNVVRP